MNSRSYAVIGLGQFGMTVALTLADAGCDVLMTERKMYRTLRRRFPML